MCACFFVSVPPSYLNSFVTRMFNFLLLLVTLQIPDADDSVDVPAVSGDASVAAPSVSLPGVSGEASLPSVGGDLSLPQVSAGDRAWHDSE